MTTPNTHAKAPVEPTNIQAYNRRIASIANPFSPRGRDAVREALEDADDRLQDDLGFIHDWLTQHCEEINDLSVSFCDTHHPLAIAELHVRAAPKQPDRNLSREVKHILLCMGYSLVEENVLSGSLSARSSGKTAHERLRNIARVTAALKGGIPVQTRAQAYDEAHTMILRRTTKLEPFKEERRALLERTRDQLCDDLKDVADWLISRHALDGLVLEGQTEMVPDHPTTLAGIRTWYDETKRVPVRQMMDEARAALEMLGYAFRRTPSRDLSTQNRDIEGSAGISAHRALTLKRRFAPALEALQAPAPSAAG